MIAFNPTVMNKDAILLLPPYWFTLKETDLDSGREERKKKKRILEIRGKRGPYGAIRISMGVVRVVGGWCDDAFANPVMSCIRFVRLAHRGIVSANDS